MRITVILLLALLGCGNGSNKKRTVGGGPTEVPVLEPVKPAALKEFRAGLRAFKVGGGDEREIARGRFEEAVRLDPTLWEAWHNIGVIAADDGDDEAAVEAFSKALKINPAHTPTRIARAEAHARGGDTDDARGDLEQAISELADDDPMRASASARLAALLRDAKKYDAAIEVLRDNLRVQGVTSRIYTELGLIYLAQNRNDLAEHVLEKAVELDAKDPAAHNAVALLFLRQGKAQEAFNRFDMATSLDPEYVDARFNKASVLLDAGDYARAKAELARIVEQEPEDYAAQVSLGLAQRGLKDHKGARSTWAKVVEDAPRRSFARADALYNLMILKAFFLEDVDGAKSDLERYLQDAPTSHPKRKEAEEKRKELGL